MRIHPLRPKEGVRASEPDELWHMDTTVIKLIDGTKVFLHTVIDNFSAAILKSTKTAVPSRDRHRGFRSPPGTGEDFVASSFLI